MAMQTSVNDKYSTNLAAAFYTNLSTSDHPLASQALALGRQQLERDRRKALERGEHVPSEYASPIYTLPLPTPPWRPCVRGMRQH